MLKQGVSLLREEIKIQPAAFGRLCVETMNIPFLCSMAMPAAFGRLCVETGVLSALTSSPC